MVQLQFLSGRQAGTSWVARRFPVRVGRAARSDLKIEEPGVWDDHLQLVFRPKRGVELSAQPDSLTLVNGEPVQTAVLRNGDLIEVGAAKLRFWLSPTRQRGLGFRESLTWIGIGLLSLGQIVLIYWLVKFV